jgi:hypothetical protein
VLLLHTGGALAWLSESETLLGQVERCVTDLFGPSHPSALSAHALLGHVLITGGFIAQVGWVGITQSMAIPLVLLNKQETCWETCWTATSHSLLQGHTHM